ncbi:MAG: TonB-dependent receptor domain-containing protein [Longimicrobiaceae bacterium]
MNRIGGILLAVLAVAGSTAASAQTAPPAGARPQGPPGAMAGAAQQAGGEIRGIVRDAASGQPLVGASIAVRSARDSALVTGAVTRADGSFRVEGLRPGAYYLRVSRLGYTTGTVSPVAVTPAAQSADVGVVRLAAGAVALQGITATTERAEVTTAPDRTVVSTRNMPAVTGGNATDVLRNVPGVDVDGDGKVSLRGNQNVAIQINGRPAPLTGDALTNFIKQLPANLVDRVEVVPNPSAKYDPDGMGGILNIVLKQNADLGTSGGLTVGTGTGGKYSASGNLGHQSGPLTLFGSYGFNRDARNGSGNIFRDQHFDGAPQTLLEQISANDFANTSHTVNATGELKLGARNVLSSSFMLNRRAADVDGSNGYTLMDAARVVTGTYGEATAVNMSGLSTDYSLSFKRTVQPQRNELSAELRFNRSRDEQGNQFTTVPGPNPPPSLRGDSRTDLDNVTRQLNAQVDYTRQLGATRLETGYKGTFRRLSNDFTLDSLFGGVPDLSLRLVNDFTYDENVHAGYGLVTRAFGPLSLQGGLRLEHAATTFRLADAAQAFDNDYTSLFPSAAATWQPSQKDQLRFSYSKRIQRPQAQFLNPFPFSQDRYSRFVGNPELEPEYTHSYELSYQRSVPFGSLTLTPFYRHTVNAVRRYQEVDAEGVTTMTLANLTTANSYGTDANGQLRLGKLSGFVGVTAYRMVTDGSNVQTGLGSSAMSWSARGSLNFKLSPSTDVQWFQFYRAPQKMEQGRMGAMQMANVAVRQKLSEHSSLSLRVMDPFDAMRFRMETTNPGLTQTALRRFNSRAVYLSYSYNFGSAPRLRTPQPQQQDPQPQQDPAGVPGPG